MRTSHVLFFREHALLRDLAALRRLRRDWEPAAARFVDALPRGEPVDLHVYFEARCEQACEFCAQPVQRDSTAHLAIAALQREVTSRAGDLVRGGAFEALIRACARRAAPVHLTITGHDWIAHPERDAILDVLARNPGLRLRLQGPSTALADAALARRVASLPDLAAVALTVQAGEARAHDRMVGRAGAFDAVCAAVDHLLLAGARVEVNTVLTRDALAALPSTLAWLAARELMGSLAAFSPEVALPWPGPLMPRLAALRESFSTNERELLARASSLVGFPLCVVPPSLASRAFAHERSTGPAARACVGCDARARCPGASRAYLDAHGEGDLVPLSARDQAAPQRVRAR